MAGVPEARPADPVPPSNDDCLACHAEPGQTRADGRALGADLGRFADSVHGQAGAACIDCHADLAKTAEFPHVEKLRPAECSGCHAEAATQYAASVHAVARARGRATGAATCADCHGAHDILPAKDPASRTNHFKLVGTCGACHGDPQRISSGAVPGGEIVARYHDSIHGRALEESGLTVAPHCAHLPRQPRDPLQPGPAEPGVPGQRGRHLRHLPRGHPHALRDERPRHAGQGRQPGGGGLQRLPQRARHPGERAGRGSSRSSASAAPATRSRCAPTATASTARPPRWASPAWPPARIATTSHDILPRVGSALDRGSHAPDAHLRAMPRGRRAPTSSSTTPTPTRTTRSAARPCTTPRRFMKVLLAGVFAFFGIHTALWFPREVATPAAPEGRRDGSERRRRRRGAGPRRAARGRRHARPAFQAGRARPARPAHGQLPRPGPDRPAAAVRRAPWARTLAGAPRRLRRDAARLHRFFGACS